jgi:arginyl-tRNA synthetase
MTNDISQRSFDEIYSEMSMSFDYTLGESFYRDKVDRVYRELMEKHIVRVDNGALCVFYEEHDHFNKQPFIIKKLMVLRIMPQGIWLLYYIERKC